MSNTWLVLDAYYLGYRAFHSKGWMQFGSLRTGVTYGILQDVIQLQDAFATDRIVFCFDYGKGKRKDAYPDYKANREERRQEMDPGEKELYIDFKRQMEKLRSSYLHRIGYRNVLWEHGYEADDIIATVVRSIPQDDEAVIISADADLYQLLAPNVMIHNLNKMRTITMQSFKKEFGIEPSQWVKVKAIAGCSGDNVPGIKGVGEKTALKYLLGQLKPTSAAFASIKAGWKDVVLRNRPLVELPYAGTPVFELVDDQLSKAGWGKVADELGLESLRNKLPMSGRQARRPLLKHAQASFTS